MSRTGPAFSYDIDDTGPRLGPVPLLDRTGSCFDLCSADTLEHRLAVAFGRSLDVSGLWSGLDVVCRAMNDGDLAKAAVAMAFLRLPAERGSHVFKASADDPIHPGWPAKSPGGKGGQFRAKGDDELDPDPDGSRAEQHRRRIERLTARRGLRSILRRVLSFKRVFRLFGEVATDAIPGVDLISGATTVIDLTNLANEIATEVKGSKAALEYAERGPFSIESLRADPTAVSFSTYAGFLKSGLGKRYGSAGEGYEYHHIVEQGRANASLFTAQQLQSTDNIIKLPKLLHEEVNAFYGSKIEYLTGDQTFREFVAGSSFETQRHWGLWALHHLGLTH